MYYKLQSYQGKSGYPPL